MSTTIKVDGSATLPFIGATRNAPTASVVRVVKDGEAIVLDLGFMRKVAAYEGGGESFGRIAGAALTRDEAESLISAIQRELGTVPSQSPVVPQSLTTREHNAAMVALQEYEARLRRKAETQSDTYPKYRRSTTIDMADDAVAAAKAIANLD